MFMVFFVSVFLVFGFLLFPQRAENRFPLHPRKDTVHDEVEGEAERRDEDDRIDGNDDHKFNFSMSTELAGSDRPLGIEKCQDSGPKKQGEVETKSRTNTYP
jgi:hypothetical protein